MCSNLKRLPILLLWISAIESVSLIKQHSYFMDSSGAENDVADLMVSKGYLPSEKDLPKTSILKNPDNDVTYLLSKLSDDELLKLLNDQPKKNVYDLNDIVKVATDQKTVPDIRFSNFERVEHTTSPDTFFLDPNVYDKSKRFRTVNEKGQEKQEAFFRLDDKRVDPFSVKSDGNPNYVALQKINNLLYSRPLEEVQNSDEEEERKELLFDVLVSQLKTLCCKRNKSTRLKKVPYKSLLNDIPLVNKLNSKPYAAELKPRLDKAPTEYMFLIINDEIKGNGSEELISVDPESLEKNSSVLLLGPITTPLTNSQLKSVMTRIANELSRPDYLPLLQQIAQGALTGSNVQVMKSLITGPETRRYIKPHRCNHQSPLAKIYGGPKWIICTGYLNLNIPSLYDRK